MAQTVAEGVVIITADASDIPKEVARQVEKGAPDAERAGKSVGKSVFGGIIGAGAVLAGANMVGDFFSSAITGASDLAETASKSTVIFGDQARAIDTWGNNAAKNLGLAKSEAIAAAAGFGNMFTQLGFTSDQAAAMSQTTVQMAADLGSFNNLPTADVADRISAAMRGEYDSLQALVPNINAARVEQEALAATGKTSADQLTAQEKAAATLAIVQKDGAAAMGDYARTADGAANTQKTLTASLADQQAALGTALLPVWTEFMDFLSTTVVPILTTVVTWISENVSWLTPLAIGIGVVTAAFWLLNIAMNANPLMLIVTAIGLLVGGIIWVATQTTFFQDVWNGAMSVIGAVIDWLWNSVINPVITAIGAAWDWLYNSVIAPVILGIQVYIGIWAAIFTWLWNSIISPTINAIGAAFQWVWASVIQPVANFIGDAIRNVGLTVQTIFGGIADFIGSAFQAALGAVRGPINGIISLVNSAIRGINSLHVTIPDWVPLVGGQTWGLNIPTIPMLARGSNNAPDAFIAGERGPELITGARGATVRPYSATKDILAGGGGNMYVEINEANDPLGTVGRLGREYKKWKAA